MHDLTDGQLSALRNLARKRSGGVTPFLNIADAQHLTEIGFAARNRQGWEITHAGAAHLNMLGGEAPDDGGSVTNFPSDDDPFDGAEPG